jgi:inner membrane protein
MDTLTHALSGALLGRAAGRRQPLPGGLPPAVRGWVGFGAAAFPDIEGALRFVDELLYMEYHRGETHSFLLLPLWAFVVGGVFHLLYRRRYRLGGMVLIAALGIAIHVGGDLITAYGTRIFAPLSDYAPAPGWVLVIDPWLTLLIVLALLASWRRPHPGVAVAGLALVVGFVSFQALLNQRAAAWGQAAAREMGWDDARIRSLAQPFSPFNRAVILERDGTYQRARVNLLRRAALPVDPEDWRLKQLYRSYRPLGDPGWEQFDLLPDAPVRRALAREAWNSPAMARYRAFAHHPVLYRLDGDGSTACVWFTDLRYWYHPVPAPFRFGACRERVEDTWTLYELLRDGSRARPLGS